MTNKAIVDRRGYSGPERNRELDPEQVVWARREYFGNRVTARQLSIQFGMSIDSVRRMLRGDTYANVGQQLPRVDVAGTAAMDLDKAAEESAKRLAEMLQKREGKPKTEEPNIENLFEEPAGGGEAAVEAFLKAPKK